MGEIKEKTANLFPHMQDEPAGEGLSERDLKQIVQMVSSLKYGSVTLIIQAGKVVQIDKNEKIRLS
ncbi:MAG: YezD family protein [Treponema sp.]|jgi:hypothetical protein|nr:YezD family protein [Treponema sp.]